MRVSRSLDSAHRWRSISTWIAAIGLVLSWMSVVRNSWFRTSQPLDPWINADWFINYQGGPIRRGLAGELLLRLSADVRQGLVWVVAMQLLLLAVLYGVAYLLFLRTTRSPAWLMLLLSPAFLLFPVLTSDGGLRKELLGLVALALVAIIVSRHWTPWLLLIPYVLFGLGVLTHESIALLLPAFIFLIAVGSRRECCRAHAVAGGVLLAILALVALGAALARPGSLEQVDAICSSLQAGGATPEACTGAVTALSWGLVEAMQQVSAQFPPYFAYLPLALLALAPMVAVRPAREFWWLAIFTYGALTPLFLTGVDYGRWIYLATSAISISLLAMWGPRARDEMRVPAVVAVLFIVMWSLPYSDVPVQRPLYGQLLAEPYHAVASWLSQRAGLS